MQDGKEWGGGMCWWDTAEEQPQAGRWLLGFALPGPAFFL